MGKDCVLLVPPMPWVPSTLSDALRGSGHSKQVLHSVHFADRKWRLQEGKGTCAWSLTLPAYKHMVLWFLPSLRGSPAWWGTVLLVLPGSWDQDIHSLRSVCSCSSAQHSHMALGCRQGGEAAASYPLEGTPDMCELCHGHPSGEQIHPFGDRTMICSLFGCRNRPGWPGDGIARGTFHRCCLITRAPWVRRLDRRPTLTIFHSVLSLRKKEATVWHHRPEAMACSPAPQNWSSAEMVEFT